MNNNVSRRARRMQRQQLEQKASPLNLVSLMDIFTILVFFLLVNSSNTQQLPRNKDLTLPKAAAEKAADETLILVITKSEILVQGRKIIELKELESVQGDSIEALKKELDFLSIGFAETSIASETSADGQAGKRLTIMGDENISYDVVRKILTTCQQANFTNISFAATQIAGNAQK